MQERTLPAELVSLVHYVKLNEAKWWDKAMRQLIVTMAWVHAGGLTLGGILEQLRKGFSVNLPRRKASAYVEELCRDGVLVQMSDARLKVSEASLRVFEQGRTRCLELEKRAADKFMESVKACCPAADPREAWAGFNDGLLIPVIREMGARTYELVSGAAGRIETTASLADFLQRWPPELRQGLRAAALAFLDPNNADVRSYILRQLNAHFLLEAGNLSEETLSGLARAIERSPGLCLFLDTNCVFSVLGLHENPSNEAARALMRAVKSAPPQVQATIYVAPITVEETKRVLRAGAGWLRPLGFTPNLADAALRTGLTGLVHRYAEEARKGSGVLRAEDYFRPYSTDLLAILGSKEVQLLDENLDHYKTDQRVIDDLMEQMEFEKKQGEQRRLGFRPKGYEQLEHDMILWHFANDRRPEVLESPLYAGCWVVTVDYRFLGFDAYKRKRGAADIPVCVHPAALVQMLQFWVPRTEEFEQAVLRSLSLPFLFQEFDPEAERVTIAILEALARFENVGDLSTEAIGRILVDGALRSKLSGDQDIAARIALVKEALIEDNRRMAGELQRARADAGAKGKTIDALQEKLANLERELQASKDRDRARTALLKFGLTWGPPPLLLVAGCIVFAVLAVGVGGRLWTWLAAACVCLATVSLWLADRSGSKSASVASWRPFAVFHRFRKWLFGILAAVALGLLIDALSDFLRSRLG